jgi:hypothetical protein
MSEQCHWKGCDKPAVREETTRDGEIWTWLCQEHADALDNAIASGSIPLLMSSWIKAQGGAEAAAKSIDAPPEVMQRFANYEGWSR